MLLGVRGHLSVLLRLLGLLGVGVYLLSVLLGLGRIMNRCRGGGGSGSSGSLGLLHLVSLAGGVNQRETALLVALEIGHQGPNKGSDEGEPKSVSIQCFAYGNERALPDQGTEAGDSADDRVPRLQAHVSLLEIALVVAGATEAVLDGLGIGSNVSRTGPSGEPQDDEEAV